MIKSYALILSLVGFALVGCAQKQAGQNASNTVAKGAISGAVAGGAIGYATLGGGSGRLVSSIIMGGLGAYVGTTLADNLNHWDRKSMRDATFTSLASANTGEPTYWESEYSSNRGMIVPTRTYLDASGRLCRDYKAELSVDGHNRAAAESACLTNSGSWIIYPAAT